MSKKYDLTNQQFGSLTVIEKTTNPKSKSKNTFWLCQCTCGNTSIVSTVDLRSGKTHQCWHCAHADSGKAKRKDLTGQKFGKLTVEKMLYGQKEANGKTRTYCECRCDCGNKVTRNVDSLKRGYKLMSCGCARKEIGKQRTNDVTGQKKGRLLVLEEYYDTDPHKLRCKCDCGNEIMVDKTDWSTGHTQSCGCLHRERTIQNNTKEWYGYISDFGVKAIRPDHQNGHGTWLWIFECPLCHKEFSAIPAVVASGKTISCGCSLMSKRERLISDYLSSLNVSFIPQYSYKDCKDCNVLRFDFALLNESQEVYQLIEYDGQQHFIPIDYWGGEEGLRKSQHRDKIKDEYCKSHNIPLLRLRYDLTDDEIKQEIAKVIYP